MRIKETISADEIGALEDVLPELRKDEGIKKGETKEEE